jgi:hypothetical protein
MGFIAALFSWEGLVPGENKDLIFAECQGKPGELRIEGSKDRGFNPLAG